MSTLHDLLDGVADGALARDGVPAPDPAAALARAGVVRRRAVRRRARLVAAAAVVVALAGSAAWVIGRPPPVAAPAAGTPRGLPEHWYTPPVWVPLVSDEPIEAASLLLAAPVHPAYDDRGGDMVLVTGAVLVSADGTQYRRVPLGPGAAAVSLAPSGRRVAWLESDPEASVRTTSDLVVLDLATGRRRVVPVPGNAARATVSWFPGERRLAVTLDAGDPGADRREGWLVGLDGGTQLQCRCGVDGTLVADPRGSQRTAGVVVDAPGATPLGVPAEAVAGDGRVASAVVAVSPDGRRTAWLAPESGALLVTDDSGATLRHPLPDELVPARLLAWTARGVLAATDPEGTRGSVLWALDPQTGAATRIGSGPSRTTVGGVARTFADRATVRGAAPSNNRLSRGYVRDLVSHPGSHPVLAAAASAGGVLGLLAVFALVVGAVGVLVGRSATRGLVGERRRRDRSGP